MLRLELKPESQDAPLNKYAFADYRVDNKDLNEPDNEIERSLIDQITRHIVDNDKIDKKYIRLIKKILSDGQYEDMFVPLSGKEIYRGMIVNFLYIEKLLSQQQLEHLHRLGKLTVAHEFVYVPKSYSSSWSIEINVAKRFAKGSIDMDNYAVIITAHPSKNNKINFFDLKSLYSKIAGFSEFKKEKEVLAIGNVNVSNISIRMLGGYSTGYSSKKQSYMLNLTAKNTRQDIHDLINYLNSGGERLEFTETESTAIVIYDRLSEKIKYELKKFYVKYAHKMIVKEITDTILFDAFKTLGVDRENLNVVDDKAMIRYFVVDSEKFKDGLATKSSDLDSVNFDEVLKNFLLYLIDQPDRVLLADYKSLLLCEDEALEMLIENSPDVFDIQNFKLKNDKKTYYSYLVYYLMNNKNLDHKAIVELLTLFFEDKWFCTNFKVEKSDLTAAMHDPRLIRQLISSLFSPY